MLFYLNFKAMKKSGSFLSSNHPYKSGLNRNLLLRKLFFFPMLLLVLLFFSISCTNVYFENPQPAGQEDLSAFPKKLTGTYVDIEKGDTVVVIYSDGFTMDMSDNDVKIPLGEKAVLRKYRSYYFLSLKQEDSNLWAVYIVKPAKKKSLEIYDFPTDEQGLSKLGAITNVKKENREGQDSQQYILNPSAEEMDKLLKAGILEVSQKIKK